VFNLGFGELVVVLVVALVFLGPKMLPEIASGLGKIIREIRKTTADIRQDVEIDEAIRGPLRELRDAATLPPEELKRRDEAKEARRKAEAEAEARRQAEAKEAEEAERKRREQEAAAQLAGATVVEPLRPAAAEVITAGGTMIASPPPSDEPQTLTPLPEVASPPPVVAAPPPLPPRPPPPPLKSGPPQEATMFDLQAQLRAAAEAKSTLAGRPVLAPQPSRPIPPRPPEGKKG
jgi:sec-independent protein translocase protein TatB